VLQCGVFVMALVGEGKRPVERLFEASRKGWHYDLVFTFVAGRPTARGFPHIVTSFHHALERMLVFARKVHHLCDFCFGNLVGEYAALADAVMMHVQHDLRSRLAVLVEKALQHMNHEFHRRVVVVEDQHTIEVRLLGLRLGARDNGAARRSVPAPLAAVVVGRAFAQIS